MITRTVPGMYSFPPSQSFLFLEVFADDCYITISERCKTSRVSMPTQLLLNYN